VVISQRLESLSIPSFADQPTRRFGHKIDEANLGNGWETLQDGRNSPCPSRVDFKCAECGPGRAKKC
jgi:hypothetical protein